MLNFASRGIFFLSIIISAFCLDDIHARKNISNASSEDMFDHFFYTKQHIIVPRGNEVLFNREDLEKKCWLLTVYPYSPAKKFDDGTSCDDIDVIKSISLDSLPSFSAQHNLDELFYPKNVTLLDDHNGNLKHTMKGNFIKFTKVGQNEDIQSSWFMPEFLKYHRDHALVFTQVKDSN